MKSFLGKEGMTSFVSVSVVLYLCMAALWPSVGTCATTGAASSSGTKLQEVTPYRYSLVSYGLDKTLIWAADARVPVYVDCRSSDDFTKSVKKAVAIWDSIVAADLEFAGCTDVVAIGKNGTPDEEGIYIFQGLVDLDEFCRPGSKGCSWKYDYTNRQDGSKQSYFIIALLNQEDLRDCYGNQAYMDFLVLHEMGHALGLGHPFENGEPDTFSVMSYNEPTTYYPSKEDIDVFDHLYANAENRSGDKMQLDFENIPIIPTSGNYECVHAPNGWYEQPGQKIFCINGGVYPYSVNGASLLSEEWNVFCYGLPESGKAEIVSSDGQVLYVDAQSVEETEGRDSGVSPSFTGWWYDSDEPGTGLAVEVSGNTIFLAWFVFDDQGRTTWYSAGGDMTSADSFNGPLYSWTGWSWGDDYATPSRTEVGTVQISFVSSPARAVTLNVNIGGHTVTKDLTPFMEDFAPGQQDSRSITGWWYSPTYDGMGFFMDAQGGKLALAWYNYREDSSARWWTSSGDFPDGATRYSGSLFRWQGGQCATCTYSSAPQSSLAEVDTIEIVFSDSTHAVIQVGGQTINLQKFLQ